jgi:aspartate/methionine/tyrosine aminotransferase
MIAMPALSPRMNGIHASPASILRRRARELRAAGRDIIELSSGNLDFATPDHVIAAAQAAALRGETRYTDVDGTPELKQAVRADGGSIRTDRDFAAYLLERADVVVFPGEDFGLSPYIRVSFANSPSAIEEAGQRLKRACDRLQ